MNEFTEFDLMTLELFCAPWEDEEGKSLAKELMRVLDEMGPPPGLQRRR
jgi:hypothetical protein